MTFIGDSIDKCKKGIYKIFCSDTGEFYIGCAYGDKGVWGRYLQHKNLLVKRAHYNSKLQSLFDIYGESQIQFIVLFTIKDKTNISASQEKVVSENLSSFKCINPYKGGRADRLSKEYWVLRNYVHSNTLANTPDNIKKQRLIAHSNAYKNNRKEHRNYKPININIKCPGKSATKKQYESESEFFEKTKFEQSILLKLKREGVHAVKRRTTATRHNFAVGTVITLI